LGNIFGVVSAVSLGYDVVTTGEIRGSQVADIIMTGISFTGVGGFNIWFMVYCGCRYGSSDGSISF